MDTLTEAQQQLYDWLVDYIRQNQHSPSIRQMTRAMGLKSPAPVQSRLEHLKAKGYIDWTEGTARTIRLVRARGPGVPILGKIIEAGGLVKSFDKPEEIQYLDITHEMLNPHYFALCVQGLSMINALIDDGDVVILEPVTDPKTIRNGTIVAACVEEQTTLKYFHRKGSKVTLQAGNPDTDTYPSIEVPVSQIDIQGVVVAVWRSGAARKDEPLGASEVGKTQSNTLENSSNARLAPQTRERKRSLLVDELDAIQSEIERIRHDAVSDTSTNQIPGIAPPGCSISFYTVKRGNKTHGYYKLICLNDIPKFKNAKGEPVKHLHLGKENCELYQAAKRAIERRNRIRQLESRLKKLRHFQDESKEVAA